MTANKKAVKGLIVAEVMSSIQSCGGRFLKNGGDADDWFTISAAVAREKVSHAIRDRVRERRNGKMTLPNRKILENPPVRGKETKTLFFEEDSTGSSKGKGKKSSSKKRSAKKRARISKKTRTPKKEPNKGKTPSVKVSGKPPTRDIDNDIMTLRQALIRPLAQVMVSDDEGAFADFYTDECTATTDETISEHTSPVSASSWYVSHESLVKTPDCHLSLAHPSAQIISEPTSPVSASPCNVSKTSLLETPDNHFFLADPSASSFVPSLLGDSNEQMMMALDEEDGILPFMKDDHDIDVDSQSSAFLDDYNDLLLKDIGVYPTTSGDDRDFIVSMLQEACNLMLD
jgi:hypothetical protein